MRITALPDLLVDRNRLIAPDTVPSQTLASRPRMILSMDVPQPILIDMGVYLRGRYVNMSKHFLHAPQIGASAEQVRCKTVS